MCSGPVSVVLLEVAPSGFTQKLVLSTVSQVQLPEGDLPKTLSWDMAFICVLQDRQNFHVSSDPKMGYVSLL